MQNSFVTRKFSEWKLCNAALSAGCRPTWCDVMLIIPYVAPQDNQHSFTALTAICVILGVRPTYSHKDCACVCQDLPCRLNVVETADPGHL